MSRGLSRAGTARLWLGSASGHGFFKAVAQGLAPALAAAAGEIFSLFKLSQTYLMRKRLGKDSQIDVVVKIFNLHACFRSFPWSWATSGSSCESSTHLASNKVGPLPRQRELFPRDVFLC